MRRDDEHQDSIVPGDASSHPLCSRRALLAGRRWRATLRRLSSPENCEYLTGLRTAFGLTGVADNIEEAFQNWNAAGGDYNALFNADFSSVLPALAITYDRRSHEANCQLLDERRPHPSGPRLYISILDCARAHVVVVPMFLLVNHLPTMRGKYSIYIHTLYRPGEPLTGGLSYIGMTRQGWASRWLQHISSARAGSPYRFHAAIRGAPNSYWEHHIDSCGLTRDEALRREEFLVELHSLYPLGLNMIPGGTAGLRFLARYGFKASHNDWEHRHQIIEQLGRHCSRSGRPNPLAATLWRDDQYASSVICANPNNFDRRTIGEIRYLASVDRSPGFIAEKFGCDIRRVFNLLSGNTYSRVH